MKELTGGCLCAHIRYRVTGLNLCVDPMVPWLAFADKLPRLATHHWEHGYPKRD